MAKKGPIETLRYSTKSPVPMGNEVSVTAGVGCGVGYVVRPAGGQGLYGSGGPPKPMGPRSGDVMSEGAEDE
jgi:hypothetical protein